MNRPLADLIRPTSLSDVVGQTHLIGEGKILRKIIESTNIPNMIFYGPSGVGKTTIANIIANKTNKKLYKLNGTNAGVKEIKEIVTSIGSFDSQNGILLYLDEIQYLNKKQQQSLLEYIENGDITLIASTTENPYFYVYNAILSRCSVFEFKAVTKEEISIAIKRAFSIMEKTYNVKFNLTDEIVEYMSISCGGDVRKSINAIELISSISVPKEHIDWANSLSKQSNEESIKKPNKKTVDIDFNQVKLLSQKSSMKYDRDGDFHYDILSAFQKSIRGSDENAALHYLARLIVADDLPSICRRLMVIACEDISLAYPQAASIVKSCVDIALALGFPEARIPLAQAVILLATAPKSNSAINAIDAAIHDVNMGNFSDVPNHLRDTHYSGATSLGRGGYVYPHDFPNHYVSQQYLPDKIKDRKYYVPGENKFEMATKQYWDKIKNN